MTAPDRPERVEAMTRLREMDADVEQALEQINVPAYVIDVHGIIRWVNPAGQRVVGDVTGRQFTSVVAPEETRRARESFAQKVVGGVESTDDEVVLVQDDGDRINVEISAVRSTRATGSSASSARSCTSTRSRSVRRTRG